MVGFETPRSRVASPTVAAPRLSRSTMSRRVGWARALNVSLAIGLTIYSRLRDPGRDTRVVRSRAIVAVIAVLLGMPAGCGGDGTSGGSETREGAWARTTGRHSVGQGTERIANPVGQGPAYVSLGMETPPPSPRGVVSLRD